MLSRGNYSLPNTSSHLYPSSVEPEHLNPHKKHILKSVFNPLPEANAIKVAGVRFRLANWLMSHKLMSLQNLTTQPCFVLHHMKLKPFYKACIAIWRTYFFSSYAADPDGQYTVIIIIWKSLKALYVALWAWILYCILKQCKSFCLCKKNKNKNIYSSSKYYPKCKRTS